ncbi:GIY-YIG nuclease family protein [Geodermatophilus marinus]|uniref:GIY-YIG nuclease family protein n=1 Tax=Geodermatophilus sp. LHW52908 TaxID=2303986 RepID=UPI000E3CCE95|nr:GIY-YIG nuclease family protein [Geodermatophilus sp. LHW52908]RFU19155.1 GIY-YIG nuclease family protein [Geodermatophilus sp. LHW52908]
MTKAPPSQPPAVSAPGKTVSVSHKWGFGMAAVKRPVQARREAAAASLLEFVAGDLAPRGRMAELQEQLAEVKGLFSRAHLQDQWDWFTVWRALGRPGRRRAQECALSLGGLRRALGAGEPEAARQAADRFTAAGGIHSLRALLTDPPPLPQALGFVYVLSTRESPGLLKVGYTERDVEERVAEINAATGVAIPFGVRAVWTVRDARRLESEVHALLAEWRVRPDREFFAMDYRDAFRLINGHLRRSRAEE